MSRISYLMSRIQNWCIYNSTKAPPYYQLRLIIPADHVHPPLYDPSVSILWWLRPAGYYTMSQTSNHLKVVSWTWQWTRCTEKPSTDIMVLIQQSTFERWWKWGSISSVWSWETCSNCVMPSCHVVLTLLNNMVTRRVYCILIFQLVLCSGKYIA